MKCKSTRVDEKDEKNVRKMLKSGKEDSGVVGSVRVWLRDGDRN